MGLVNRVVGTGGARQAAVDLAAEIARFPRAVMRADRRSALTQWDSNIEDAMAREFAWGIEAASSGETQQGAERFAAGHGRHGDFDDI